MRPLRFYINVTLDGCCDHRAISADEDLHRHAVENLNQADALLFGRVTYEMMEAAFRPPARTGARPDWMEPTRRRERERAGDRRGHGHAVRDDRGGIVYHALALEDGHEAPRHGKAAQERRRGGH